MQSESYCIIILAKIIHRRYKCRINVLISAGKFCVENGFMHGMIKSRPT